MLALTTMKFDEFYTGGGKRSMTNNVERRDVMSDCFMNRNGGGNNVGGHFPECANYAMMGHSTNSYLTHNHYDSRSMSTGRSRSRSSRRSRRYYYTSDESTPERIRHRRRRNHYKDNEKRSESPNNNKKKSIVQIDD